MIKSAVLSLLVLFQVLGDVWLSRGMRQVGGVTSGAVTGDGVTGLNPATLVAIGLQVLTNPWIILGVCFLIGSLLLYLAAISQFDLSYVLPMTAAKYVLSAVLASSVLGEQITGIRWLGTGLVSGGVLWVGFSEVLPRNARKPLVKKRSQAGKRFPALLLLPFSFSLALSHAWLAIVAMVVAASAGDLLLTAGMRQVGAVASVNLRSLLHLAGRAATNPLIGLGIGCMAADFFLFIGLLSGTDLSLVVPMTALSYPLSLCGSRYFLKETVSFDRWAGVGLIGIGVGLISLQAGTL